MLDRRAVLAALTGSLAGCAPLVMQPQTAPSGFDGPRFEPGALVSFDGARLPLNVWAAAGEPWAVVIALHGMNDYAMAFADDGPALAAAGVITYAYDQRGFGRGPGRGLWAGETLLKEDLRAAVEAARRQYPRTPIAVLGHSMGGAVAICAFAGENPPPADRLILAAPAVWGWSAQPIPNRVALWLGAHMQPGAHLDPPAWITRSHRASDNIAALRRMGSDPNMLFTTRMDAVYGLVNLMQSALDCVRLIRTPTLYLYGAHDLFVPRDATLAAVRQLKGSDRSAYYPDGWHLLLRDLHGDLVRSDILAWLKDPRAVLPSGFADIPSGLRSRSG